MPHEDDPTAQTDLRTTPFDPNAHLVETVDKIEGTVQHTIDVNEWLAGVPGHEANAQEGIIAGEQEMALLQVERELGESGRAATPEGRRFLHEATATIRELSEEDSARRMEPHVSRDAAQR
jgi:hypothetical protein